MRTCPILAMSLASLIFFAEDSPAFSAPPSTTMQDSSPQEIHRPLIPPKLSKTRPLFNGKDLQGWHLDIPAADNEKNLPPSFIVREGNLVSQGKPRGHLITDEAFQSYRLKIDYRWPGKTGNCGVLIHVSKPRRLNKMFPQSIECQLHAGHAGDFWCIGEDIRVLNMEARRGPKEKWGVDKGRARRIKNLTDDSEKPPGEWNQMVIECRGRIIEVWVNGDLVNSGFECTADHGRIAIQAEGAVCEFRRIEITDISDQVEVKKGTAYPGKKDG